MKEQADEFKQRLVSIESESTKMKLDNEKDWSLQDQELGFKNKIISELERKKETLEREKSEIVEKMKLEYEEELTSWLGRLQSKSANLEDKYEEKKWELKEVENRYSGEVTALEKEKAILTQKLQNTTDSEAKSQKLIQEMKEQLDALKERQRLSSESENDQIEKLNQDKEALLAQLREQERQFTDKENDYDKEMALLRAKNEFLDKQREDHKKEMKETSSRFEMTLQQVQIKKESDSKNHNMVMQKIEQKYKKQM